MRRDVFQAIADPVRRDIIDLLARNELTPNAIAEHFKISRPAISKHLRVLRECGLVHMKPKGRERICELKHLPLNDVVHWIDEHKRLWDKNLVGLKKEVILKSGKQRKE